MKRQELLIFASKALDIHVAAAWPLSISNNKTTNKQNYWKKNIS